MTFGEITKNDRLLSQLRQTILGGQVHHGYIFEGAGNTDKMRIAKSFAQALLCRTMPGEGCGVCDICQKIESENHIDLTLIRPSKAEGSKVYSVKDGDIENLIRRLQKKPYEGERNIGIVESIETITPRAANRLLKTLEEPPVGTVMMLLCENTQILPRTIVSRCVIGRVQNDDCEFTEELSVQARLIVDLLIEKAPFYKMKKEIEGLNQEKDQILVFLDCFEGIYGEILKEKDHWNKLFKKDYLISAIEAIEMAKNDIKNNIGVRYVMMNLILKIGG